MDHTYGYKSKLLFSNLKFIELFCAKDWTDSINLGILNTPEQVKSLKEKVKIILEKIPRIFTMYFHDAFIKKCFLA